MRMSYGWNNADKPTSTLDTPPTPGTGNATSGTS